MKSRQLIINDEGRVCTPVCNRKKTFMTPCLIESEYAEGDGDCISCRVKKEHLFTDATKVELSDEWQEWGIKTIVRDHSDGNLLQQYKKNHPYEVREFEFGIDGRPEYIRDESGKIVGGQSKQVAVIKPKYES